MSAEKLDRIEDRLSELRELMQQNITVTQLNLIMMQQDITVLQQNIAAIDRNVNALRDEVTALHQRMDDMEGTTVTNVVRDSLRSFRNYIDELNRDLANKDRQTGREILPVKRVDRDD